MRINDVRSNRYVHADAQVGTKNSAIISLFESDCNATLRRKEKETDICKTGLLHWKGFQES